jgi:hypothetical protein
VKHLLYSEKYTIEGARQRIDQYRRSGELKPAARAALESQILQEVAEELGRLEAILEGRPAAQAGGRAQ